MRFRIVSTGLYTAGRIETAAELAPRIGKSVEWILERTGVAKRWISNESVESMGANAARAALKGGPPPDLVINASATPRQLIPETSVFILKELGYEGIPGFSVHATCLSFVVALHNAAALIAAGAYKRILVVSAEIGSKGRNFEEPESAALLADCAAAAVVEATPEGQTSRMLGWKMGTWPATSDAAEVRGFGIRRHPDNPETRPEDILFHMDGPRIYKLGIRRGAAVVGEALKMANLKASDIDLVVPHQPSGPGVEALQRLGFPKEKVVDIIGDYGNCIAASVPTAMAVADAEGRLKRGDRVLICGTGAGLSVAAMVIEW